MLEITNGSDVVVYSAEQAAELAALVELEAGWENLRPATPRPHEPHPTPRDLHGKQKAYETFRGKLAAYNKRFSPPHVPELLLNTPIRLGRWCRAMRDLFSQVEHDSRTHCPVQLLDKAYQRADQMAAKLRKERFGRSAVPTTLRAVIQELEAIGRWCESLAGGQSQGGAVRQESFPPLGQSA
jgi:hypothetical protein